MMMGTDTMENSTTTFELFDEANNNNNSNSNSNGEGGGGLLLFDDENLTADISIDLGDLIAILNEDPSQLNHGASESFQHGDFAPSQHDHQQKIQAVSNSELDNFTENGDCQWNQNGIASREHLHDFQHFESDNVFDTSLQVPPSFDDGLLCFTRSNDPVNVFGNSLTSNFNQLPQSQNNMQEFDISAESGMKGVGFDLNCAQDDGLYRIALNTEHEAPEPDGNNICSITAPQNVQSGSTHVWPLDNFDLNDELPCSTNSSAFPDSTADDVYMNPSLVYSYGDPDACRPNNIKPEPNTFDASMVACDARNSLTFPMDFNSDTEMGLHQIVTDHFQAGYPKNIVKKDDYTLPLSRIKLLTEEESPDSPLPDASISDLDSPLSDEPSTEDNHYDETSLMSESSTDSSPIPSRGNSSFDNVDRGALDASNQMLNSFNTIWSSEQKSFNKVDGVNQLCQPWYENRDVLKGGSNAVPMNISRNSLSIEDDADICILDDISAPACPPRTPYLTSPYPVSQRPEFIGVRLDDERLTFRLALQDLSQTKSEVSPPDGVLAVPLLKHQRIALSWMVQKETASLHCSGGILADDQGLGKTISMIALILMERSPPSRTSTVVKKEDEFEALDLDDDDDDDKASVTKQPRISTIPMMMKSKPVVMDGLKGRPAAGTLVVCPTSVLRQWADELKTKVTSEANLSVLVYHGGNRTKDPNELTKYDVVLTTYAIVSMEVPKQGLADKDDEDKGKHDAYEMSDGFFDSKKRKVPPNSNMNNRIEISARPLGRVGWFRVILDEAQSIKNHRTQVARACWGLRAKRRWCLSGTPIQNAIDDLYSYFRFLRYDPYAVYQSFCSTIKNPIVRNPTNGYKKLQAVLKTIMLRRTKGTMLDGKPIINLPPKTVSLKAVEFSSEERQFYSALEAASREQFAEYEDAGTVKQNYVNILLMLLRLRQACDHPLLVKVCESNSSEKASLEVAKKLPRDKKIVLLSYLEVSLAICTICNDPPEDAVVTICGHVFCNQCISEHLTTDENICPSSNCKIRLSAASIFSRTTLKSTVSDELNVDCYSVNSGLEEEKKGIKCGNIWSPYSSKIKAVLEILQSLPKYNQCSSECNTLKSDDVTAANSSIFATNTVSVRSSLGSGGIKHIKLVSSNREEESEKAISSMNHIKLETSIREEVSEKAIIFSQWTKMLDLLEGPLKASHIKYRRLDGTMSVTARDKAIRDFKTLPEVTVIIMSLKAASLGLNLVAANHVILLDLWWNPTTEDQAIDRAHRIGQTRPVTVSRLTVNETVEEKILDLQEKKRKMVSSAFGEDESGSRQSRLTVEDLRYLFSS